MASNDINSTLFTVHKNNGYASSDGDNVFLNHYGQSDVSKSIFSQLQLTRKDSFTSLKCVS